MAHTNGIESHWAMLKRGYVGVYHQMSAKHLPRYVAEFEGRHNSRPLTGMRADGKRRGKESERDMEGRDTLTWIHQRDHTMPTDREKVP